MARDRKHSQKLISIVVATVAAGIPISTSSSRQLDFLDPSFLILWVCFGMVASFGMFLYFSLKMRDIIGTFTLGYMLAVIIRFVADILINNISHSNLTVSLAISIAVGALAGWLGAMMWTIIRKKS
ncbi:MAG: hypothetical protein WD381_06140 [Balneolaceae bacterium]